MKMRTEYLPKFCASLALLIVMTLSVGKVRADVIAEFLFWNSMGNQVGKAAANYKNYRAERDLWQSKIAAAREQMRQCGNCPAAKAELDKWQSIENQFQDVAGQLAATARMPPVVARFLGIDLPMAPGRTQAEIEEACTPVRKPWVSERPDFCQEAVEQHIACIQKVQAQEGKLCVEDGAAAFGGECWETTKQYDNCFMQDYEAFQREESLSDQRRAGAIIPEYRYPKVYYGSVPDDFIPELPPTEMMLKELNEPYNDSLGFGYRFFMDKQGYGHLDDIRIGTFSRMEVDFNSPCGEINRPKNDPLFNRVCNDYSDITWLYEARTISCRYSGEPWSYEPKYIYWYGERPAGAAIERLTQRVANANHPLLRVGEPREECPATLAEAQKVETQYRQVISEKAAKITPIPVTKDILRTEQELELLKLFEAKVKRRQEREAALEAFPKTGMYDYAIDFDLGGEQHTVKGECLIFSKSDSRFNGSAICRDTDGNFYSDKPLNRHGYLTMSLMGASYLLKVDPAHLQQKDHILTGNQARGRGHARMTRTGDLPEVAEFPLEGRYEFNILLNNEEIAVACDLARKDLYQNHVYAMHCTDEKGYHFESRAETAKVENKFFQQKGYMGEESLLLPYLSIYFDHPKLGGKEYYYSSLPWESAVNPADDLVGVSYQGHISHMTRLGDVAGMTWANDRSPERLRLSGSWVGALTAGGSIFSELEIQETENGQLQARLTFFGQETGSYLLKGVVDHEKRTFELTPYKWLEQPSRSRMVGFKGQVALTTVSSESFLRGELKGFTVGTAGSGSVRFVRENAELPSVDFSQMDSSQTAISTGTVQDNQEKRKQEILARRMEIQQNTGLNKQPKPEPLPEKPARQCTLEEIAGTYNTGLGIMECDPVEGGLNCCYSNQCRKKAELAFDESGQNLEGIWNDSRKKGPVIFPVSNQCDLTTGKWNVEGRPNINDMKSWGTWSVRGRRP